jgi:hypothetical protein
MAQHFVKEITDERAHVAAALKPTEPAKQEAPHQQPDHHDQPHAANTHEKPAHEHHQKTAAEHEMEAAIRKERHEANAALDGAAPHHNEHADHGKAPHHDSFVEKEKNIPATPPVNGIAPTNVMDRVTQPHENHLAAAEAAKAAAATQQHGVGAY